MVDQWFLVFTFFCSKFKSVHDFDFTTVLRAQEPTDDWTDPMSARAMNPRGRLRAMNILKGDDLLFWRRIRVKCSEIFRIGNGWLGGERSVRRKYVAR
jgi:hypothetical protein